MINCDLNGKAASTAGNPPLLEQRELEDFVRSFLDRRLAFLDIARDYGSPLYILERDILRRKAALFADTFLKVLPDIKIYYAMKSNSHPEIIRTFVDGGLGIDVSSGIELRQALECGATDIIFSGPGKTDEELSLAVSHQKSVIILIDSHSELVRLEKAASGANVDVNAGIRLCAEPHGLWRKFGIPLEDLLNFMRSADKCSHIRLRGLQFHTSWNLNAEKQITFIEKLGNTLKNIDSNLLSLIEFIDIGGGFWPSQGEWLHPKITEGNVLQVFPGAEPLKHYKNDAAPISAFAEDIGKAVKDYIFPHVKCRIHFEPGRWLCHDAMHLLMRVIDKKDDLIITDAGTNAIGWERFETDYFPVVNLTSPGMIEHPCYVLGSLCTPHDVWGYSYFGEDIKHGDILLIPTQGAYTYSLRQEFIKPLPVFVVMGEGKAGKK